MSIYIKMFMNFYILISIYFIVVSLKGYHSIVHRILQTLHISNAMQKLGVKGRSQAVVELLRMGELEL